MSRKITSTRGAKFEDRGDSAWSNTFQNLRPGNPVTVRFLSDPDECDPAEDWTKWREVFANEGFVGGIPPCPGLYAFPVFDTEEYEDEDGDIKVRALPRGSDLILDACNPTQMDKKNGRSRANARYVGAINCVYLAGNFQKDKDKEKYNPKENEHILLKLSGLKMEQLIDLIHDRKEEHGEFDPLAAWKISITGEGTSQMITLKKVQGYDPIEPDEIPDIRNIEETISAMRDDIEAYYNEKVEGGATSPEHEGDDDEDEEEKPPAKPKSTAKKVEKDEEPDYTTMPAVKLKALLDDAGVEYPRTANAAALRKLAIANL